MSKRARLIALLREHQPLALAFSGGTDSTLLADVAHEALGDNLLLIHIDSPLSTSRERKFARDYLEKSPAKHLIIAFDPFAVEEVAKNEQSRCYHCKYTIMSEMKRIAEAQGFPTLADGTNHNDRTAGERPGLRALSELGVWSPFADAGFTKPEIRAWAIERALPNATIPEAACLATRIPFDTRLDLRYLREIDRLENELHALGFELCRVRFQNKDTAVIEVVPERIAEATAAVVALRSEIFTTLTVSEKGYCAK